MQEKNYIQFYTYTTGYVEGSSPSKFDPNNVTLKEALRSSSKIYFDGRYSFERLIIKAHTAIRYDSFYQSYPAFKIVGKKGNSTKIKKTKEFLKIFGENNIWVK